MGSAIDLAVGAQSVLARTRELEAEAYTGGVLEAASALAGELVAAPGEGLFLSAPERIERTPGWRLPVSVSQRGTADELDRRTLEQRGLLVFAPDGPGAAHLAPLMAADAAPGPPLRLLGEEPDPLRRQPAARVTRLDAADRLALPGAPTQGTLFVVVADQRSTGHRLALGEVPPPRPGESARLVEPAVVARRVVPLDDAEGAPKAPAAGIAVAVERYAVPRPGAALVLRGAFRLPVDAARASAGGVEVTLVATGAAWPFPRALVVPVETRAYASQVVGDFAVDLFGTALCASPDTWFVHAFVAGHGGGPAVTTVVLEAS